MNVTDLLIILIPFFIGIIYWSFVYVNNLITKLEKQIDNIDCSKTSPPKVIIEELNTIKDRIREIQIELSTLNDNQDESTDSADKYMHNITNKLDDVISEVRHMQQLLTVSFKNGL